MTKTKDSLRPSGALVLLTAHSPGLVWLAKRLDSSKDYFLTYAAPGGRVEPHETSREAARRELREETGLVVPEDSLLFGGTTCHAYPSGVPFTMDWYSLRLSADVRPGDTEPEKQGPWLLFSLKALPADLTPGTAAALHAYRTQK